jgi:FkbM family methyltransferase
MFSSKRQISSEPEWYEHEEFAHFPKLFRVFRFWCAHGIKRSTGGTLGGNKFFNLVKRYYVKHPYKEDNFVTIPVNGGAFYAVLDLLDFENVIHTVPGFSRNLTEKRLLEILFCEGGCFIDVGANHGIFTLNAAYIGGDHSLIYAFEPQPRPFEALSRSKSINGFDQILAFNIALGNKEGTVDFYIPRRAFSGVGSLVKDHVGRFSASYPIKIKMTTLDRILATQELDRVDLVKVDVEGWEYYVLEGAYTTLTTYKPFLWFEMSPSAQQLVGKDQEDLFALLQSYGYRHFYNVSEITYGIKNKVGTVDRLTNVLAVPQSKSDSLSRAIDDFLNK